MTGVLSFLGFLLIVVLAAWYLNNISGEPIFTFGDFHQFVQSIKPFWRLLLTASFVGAVMFYLSLSLVTSRTLGNTDSGLEAAFALLCTVPGSAMSAYWLWYVLSKREIRSSQLMVGIVGGLVYGIAIALIVLLGRIL